MGIPQPEVPVRSTSTRIASCPARRIALTAAVVIFSLAVPSPIAAADESVSACEDWAPPIAAVHRAALETAALPQLGRRGAGRARTAGLLPSVVRLEVRDQADRWQRAETRVGQDFDDAYLADSSDVSDLTRWDERGVREVRFVVQWNLTPLLWTSDEVALSREATRAREARLELLDDVTEQYFARAALVRELAEEPEPGPRAVILDALAEIDARLDSRTGGWFTEQAEEHGERLALTCRPTGE